MTKEELLELVNKKEDTSKFKSLSQRTIDEELVDALEEIGDDESANDKVVTKLANRLKPSARKRKRRKGRKPRKTEAVKTSPRSTRHCLPESRKWSRMPRNARQRLQRMRCLRQ